MKKDEATRNLLSANLRRLMRMSGMDNPRQLHLKTLEIGRDISYDQVRFILSGQSAATIDALAHIAKALNTDPHVLLSEPWLVERIEMLNIPPKDISDLLSLFLGTTDEGRRNLPGTAHLLPSDQTD